MAKESIVEKKSYVHELTATGIIRNVDGTVYVDTETAGTVSLSYLLTNFDGAEVVIKVRTKTEE